MASRLLRCLPLVALACACATGPSDSKGTEPLGRSETAIINGQADTSHPAVVALLLGKDAAAGACTGTIIKVNVERKIGWVATAAHCLDAGVSLVVEAEDYGSTDFVQYSVIDYEADPRYSSATMTNDFAIVRIGGVDESTPVIPLATDPDGLEAGMQVTSVGFGTTGDSSNTTRRSVKKALDEVSTDLLRYDQQTSGICFGDSGGPVIAGSGASARVVGIHSFVSGGCDVHGYSARVTSGLDFYERELDKALPEPSCGLCDKIANAGAGVCAKLTASCLADEECRGYYECIGDGKKTPAECFDEFPLAEGPFSAATSCVCTEACVDECAGASTCSRVGKCGYKVDTEDACGACIESSCCEEVQDCTADGRCYLCLKTNDSFDSCRRNATRKTLATCALEKCTNECAGTNLQTIGVKPAEEADAGPPSAAEPSSSCSAAPKAPMRWSPVAIAVVALAALVRRRGGRRTSR